MRLAAIDIGSNSIHMVLVETIPGGRFEIIAAEKDMVRLASGTLMSHHLTHSRMNTALATISRFAKFAKARGAKKILATATSAVREADNQGEFVARVKELVGIDVEILSGVEEARLIALAVTEAMHLEHRRALIIDIGGGSTEFIITQGNEPVMLRSMRLGAVRLTESAQLSDPVKKKELTRLRANLRADLARTAQEIMQAKFDIVIGTSGTILNLVALAAQLKTGTEFVISNEFNNFSHTCTTEELAQINEWLSQMTEKSRANMPGLDPRRADIIVAGGQLLEMILREVHATEITTCDWALREGVLLNYIAKHANVNHADLGIMGIDEKTLDSRDKTILSLARRYEYEPVHSHQVAFLAGKLFDDLKPLHQLPDEDRVLLQYAAILHDIGYHISHNGHQRHAYYLIQNAELPGFTATEAAIMANLARFHKGLRPRRSKNPEYNLLDKGDRKRVRYLSALLRIADGLDRSHRALVTEIKVTKQENNWLLEAYADENIDLELWYAKELSDYFASIFDSKIVIRAKNPVEESVATEMVQ